MSDRDQISSDMKTLGQLTRKIDKASFKIGKSSDTTSWRRTFNADLQRGEDLVRSLQSTASRMRSDSVDAQTDKLLQQSQEPIRNFETLKQRIDRELDQNEPINDDPVQDNTAYGAYNAGGGGQADFNYAGGQQAQQQDQIEQIGLVGMAADIDHLEEQNKAVVKIADDVKELNEAFTDLNTLVNEQQEDIDHVEQNVVQAKESVQSGTKHLETAEKHQISARKKQCCILIGCIIILAVIFGLMGGLKVF
eukprot:CAMPEP_0201574816 /NCGR_PEP_ID=MMETSP0190_2-20130828/19556_1 /ASSEMBLY_ACC=CAM_ASM_000263 /TAXON_ID=37353 /ORGANISM="Rosalina sp." /LENGTH=249 /DNA_ID=CAMNT_0048003595 /DNA_START=138 /DNA_END=887 /DNA_ORIENTATION=+